MIDPVYSSVDDYIDYLKTLAPQSEEATVELERLQDAKHYNNAKRKLRTQYTAMLTREAANEIKRHLKALHLRHEFNDTMPTHRRLKIGEDAMHALDSLPLSAIAVKNGVQITLDTVNNKETLHNMTVRHGQHDYCIRITPCEGDEPYVYLNI